MSDEEKIKFLEQAMKAAMQLLDPLIPNDEWSVCLALGGAHQHHVGRQLRAGWQEYQRRMGSTHEH